MKLAPLYRAKVDALRLDDNQRGLLIDFIYCMEFRVRGIDFDQHWSAISNGQSARMEAACAAE